MVTGAWTAIVGISILWLATTGYSLGTIGLPGARLIRRKIWCAVMEREAEVGFRASGGVPYDVAECSV
ncbi:MAG: hypothetical protein AB1555_06475 [Nitrospirota bacterium]